MYNVHKRNCVFEPASAVKVEFTTKSGVFQPPLETWTVFSLPSHFSRRVQAVQQMVASALRLVGWPQFESAIKRAGNDVLTICKGKR